MSASSRNFAAARQAAFGTPENAGHGPLGNMQFQVGPDGTLRIVPVQTTTESSTESTPPAEIQDPESIAREEEKARIQMERLDRFIKMRRAKKIVNTGPPTPSMVNVRGLNYYTSVPPTNPKYAWVGNRDTNFDRWHRIGDPIREENVGPTTFGAIQQSNLNKDQFSSEHHGFNVSAEAAMPDDALRGRLSSWGLPTEGDRNTLFERVVRGNTLSDVDLRTKLGMLEKNDPEATPLTEQEKNYLIGNNPYKEAADVFRREREEGIRNREDFLARKAQQPQINPSPLNQPSTNTQLQGTTTTTTTTQPPNVVQPPLRQEPQGPLYGGTMRLGDEAPMSTSIIGGGTSESQPLTQSPNLYSRIAPQANTGAVAAEEAGAMGGMEMMASRAIPMLNMVLMGKMLMDGLTADSKQKKMQQQALMYRT